MMRATDAPRQAARLSSLCDEIAAKSGADNVRVPATLARLMNLVLRLAACVWLLAAAAPAFAWNKPGHMMTASVAYDALTPDERAWAVKILEANPDFEKWRTMAPTDSPDFDFGRYVLMMAARWPDDIRKRREDPPGTLANPYDHPLWHYSDYPLRPSTARCTCAGCST